MGGHVSALLLSRGEVILELILCGRLDPLPIFPPRIFRADEGFEDDTTTKMIRF